MNKLMNLLIMILVLGLGALTFCYRDSRAMLTENLHQCKEEAAPYEKELAILENEVKQITDTLSVNSDKDSLDYGEMILLGYYIRSTTDFSAIESISYDEKYIPSIVLDCNADETLMKLVAESDYSCILCNATDSDSLSNASQVTGSKSYLYRGNQFSGDLTSALSTAGIETSIVYIRSVTDNKKEVGYSFISSKKDSVEEDYEYAKSIHCPLLYVFDLNNIRSADGNLDHVTDSISFLTAGDREVPFTELEAALACCISDSLDLDEMERNLEEKRERIHELNKTIRDIYNRIQ